VAHFIAELQQEAASAIAEMRAAALRARELHARAELMRHMLSTVAKMKERPHDEAVRFVVDEWLKAWALRRERWPHAAAMEALAAAFYDYAAAPGDAADAVLRRAAAELEQRFAAAGLPIADEMAWRSVCAHGWWAAVRPPPPGQGRRDRDWPDRPFWEEGCPPQCL
jgi:hypothetical protein